MDGSEPLRRIRGYQAPRGLTHRQREYIAEGVRMRDMLTNKAMAKQLDIDVPAVERCITKLRKERK